MSVPTSTRTRSSTVEQDETLCRSTIYCALSLGLSRPTLERLKALRSEDAKAALLEAGRFLGAPTADWIGTVSGLTLEAWESSHTRLFAHTPRGRACPYESEYGLEGLFAQPRQLARIMGFYRAFGLETAEAERERADHVSCELEFLDFLCRKEAVAWETDDPEMLAETRKAARLFLKDHLGRFGCAFGRLLREGDPGGYFGALGDLLHDFLELECRRLGLPPGPELLPLSPAGDEGVAMACGDQSELVQIHVPR